MNSLNDVLIYEGPDINLCPPPADDRPTRRFRFTFPFRWLQWWAQTKVCYDAYLTDVMIEEYVFFYCYTLTDLSSAYEAQVWYDPSKKLYIVQFLIAD